MNKILSLIAIFLLATSSGYLIQKKLASSHKRKVGLITPAPHPALEKIILGFEKSLSEKMGDQVEIEVQNAQGDAHIQASSIQAFLDRKVDLLVTISTRTTQMALSKVTSQQPVLFLSAEIKKPLHRTLFGVNDEIDIAQHFDLILKVLPTLKKMSVVYSVNEKIIPEVEKLTSFCNKAHIQLQKIGIQSLPELSQSLIDEDTDGIFVFKDILVTNGIQILIQKANQLQKPLLVSDEESVSQGACFALGVQEQDIGKQGGILAAKFLQNPHIFLEKFYVEPVQKVQLFFHEKACAMQQVDVNLLKQVAKTFQIVTKRLP